MKECLFGIRTIKNAGPGILGVLFAEPATVPEVTEGSIWNSQNPPRTRRGTCRSFGSSPKASARTGKSFSGLLQNRKKNGEVFLNLVCINSLRVGSTFYLLGIQVDMTHSSGDRKGDVQEVVRRQLDTIVKTIMEVQQDALSRLQVPFNLSWLQAEGKDPSSFVALETQSPAVLTKNTFLEAGPNRVLFGQCCVSMSSIPCQQSVRWNHRLLGFQPSLSTMHRVLASMTV